MNADYAFRIVTVASLSALAVALAMACSNASPSPADVFCGAGTIQSGGQCVAAGDDAGDAGTSDATLDDAAGDDADDSNDAAVVEEYEKECRWTPTACAQLTAANCDTQPGCIVDGTCTGGGCHGITPGLCWTSAPNCEWVTTCAGTPDHTSCGGLDVDACAAVLGCRWY